jgi:hypothetical protein
VYRARVAFVISVSLLYLITQQGIRFARARSIAVLILGMRVGTVENHDSAAFVSSRSLRPE